MKKTLLALCVLCGLVPVAVHAAESTHAAYPIPKVFASMTNADVHPGFAPVAIYECFSNRATRVVWAGALMAPFDDPHRVILPIGIFADPRFTGAFGVRILRPDSGDLVGFIDRVALAGTNRENSTMAIGTIGTNEVHLSYQSADTNRYPMLPFFTPEPTIRGAAVKRVRSLLTGREVRIVGYGVPLTNIDDELLVKPDTGEKDVETVGTVDPDQAYLMIEDDSPGKDCPVLLDTFIDDQGRAYIFYNGFRPDGETKIGAALMKDFTSHYGVAPKGIAALAGPFVLPTSGRKLLAPTSLRAAPDRR